ncbi:MAG: aminopeptidase, partial [Schwartzia sp.]|nr:aminopeptidase [Schwartzia sp. (in: firmicutes)]
MADKKTKKKDEQDMHVWNTYSAAEKKKVYALADDYRDFISECKTERESAEKIVRMAKAEGYVELSEAIRKKKKLKAGDKVYAVGMKKTVALFRIGSRPIEDGLAILGAHIDTCRLDLKQNPLYEDGGMAYLDTHYYGGIKKYQWVTIPLALHGVVVKKDGKTLDINIGEQDDDPVFCVTDLLIHLAQEQMEKRATKVIEGEKLDILVGNLPLPDEEKNAVKAGVLAILSAKYNITKEDFISAELTLVPAGRARAMGFDRSMTLGYGQDDRVCAFTSLRAMLETKKTTRTACCLLVDKEEIGSVGATGMQSRFFENTLAE